MATLENLFTEVTAMRSEIKALAKLLRKMKNEADDPTGEKSKERSKNNGFNRPNVISEELRAFLGLEKEETISRSEVTRFINKYITENGLKHPDNGRVILIDEKLKNLLKPPEDIQVTFLNIQKYLSPHYLKKADLVKEKEEEQESAKESVPEPVASSSSTPKKTVVRRPVVKKKVAAE